MHTICPHCGKEIELVGAKELKDDFGLGPNSVQHARDRGRFPNPWLSFGNRKVYLRDTISAYIEDKSRAKIEATVHELVGAISNLPAEEQAEARRLLLGNLNEKKAS